MLYNNLKSHIFLTLFYLCIYPNLFLAQKLNPKITITKSTFQYDFTNFSSKQGLPTSNAYDVIQVKNGNYWLATDVGITIYNGQKFSVFKPAGEKGYWCLFQDSKANVWMGNNNGVTKYDGVKVKFFNDTNSIGKSAVVDIIESKDGKIWLAGYRVGLICIDNEKISIINSCNNKPVKQIYSVYEDKNGVIWVGDITGVYKLVNNKLVAFNTNILSDTRAIIQDKKGNYWFGVCGKGIFKYYNGKFEEYSVKTGAIHNNVIWCAVEDKEGKIWFSTDEGVAVEHENNFNCITEKEGLLNNRTWSVKCDNLGRILVACYSGGLSIFNGKQYKYLNTQTGLGDKKISYILKDSKQNYWFCSNGNGIIKYDGFNFTNYYFDKPKIANLVWTAYEDDEQNIWFGTDAGLIKYRNNTFTQFYNKHGPQSNFVWSIVKTHPDTFLVGSYNSGLFKFDGNNYIKASGINAQLNSSRILQLLKDDYQNIWAHADLSLKLIKPNGKVQTIDTTKGILDNIISHIYKDKTGAIWLSSLNGLSVFKTPNKLSECYTIRRNKNNIPDVAFSSIESVTDSTIFVGTNKGVLKINYSFIKNGIQVKSPVIFYNSAKELKETECTGITAYQSNESNHWFGTGNGIVVISNESEKPIKPKIEIYEADLFYNPINWTEKKDLNSDSVLAWKKVPLKFSSNYKNNHFTFKFLGSNTRNIESLSYSFILEGFETKWSDVSNRNDVTYSNLQEGDYIFKVKAISDLGVESDIEQISFTIYPPFWKTWWFRIGSITITCLVIFLIFRFRTRALLKRKKQLEEIVFLRTQELIEQKNIAEKQKELVQQKNKEIIDSIQYAKRIQQSLLPTEKYIERKLKK